MQRKNLFDGESHKAQFAIIAYRQLMSRKWVTNADIMAEYLGLKSASELPYSISKCEHVKELSKALMDIKDALGRCNVEEDGNNKSRRFRYVGKDNDPLADMRNAKAINNLRQYWKFCQDSAGFFPISWLEYFFKDYIDLLDIKRKRQNGEQVLSASLDRQLTNIELLPLLYEAIVNKQVLEMEYKPFEEEAMHLYFHPQFLKEYNGRWHLFGHAEGKEPEWTFDIALDRIVGTPKKYFLIKYKTAPPNLYNDFFKDIVGVSHKSGNGAIDIRIRAHNKYMFNLTETKKLHHSQDVVVPFGEYKDGTYGEFNVHVEVNNEFIGRILQMGAGLEIVSPIEVRKVFAEAAQRICDLYK